MALATWPASATLFGRHLRPNEVAPSVAALLAAAEAAGLVVLLTLTRLMRANVTWLARSAVVVGLAACAVFTVPFFSLLPSFAIRAACAATWACGSDFLSQLVHASYLAADFPVQQAPSIFVLFVVTFACAPYGARKRTREDPS